MSDEHYICRKIGNEFVAVRVMPHDRLLRLMLGAAGLGMILWGTRRRGPGGAALALAGIGLCAASRQIPPQAYGESAERGDASGKSGGDSAVGDSIEEASAESFPASDAPARHGSA